MELVAAIISGLAGAMLMALALFAWDWHRRRRALAGIAAAQTALLTPAQHRELAEQIIAEQGLGSDSELELNRDAPRDNYGRAGLRPGLWAGEKAATQLGAGTLGAERRTLIPDLYCEKCNEPRGGSVCPLCGSQTIDIPPEVLAEEIEAHRPKGSEP